LFSASLLSLVQNTGSGQNTSPISPELTLYSPTNFTTYTSSVVNCSGRLTIPYGQGSSLSYSIDGIPEGGVPWQLNPNHFLGDVYYNEGSFQLPPLPNGTHRLILTAKLDSSKLVDTVYFTINSNQPIPPTPSQNPTASPALSSPTPNIPELPNLSILLLLITMLFVTVIINQRKHINLKR
jgi:hypothetical protein